MNNVKTSLKPYGGQAFPRSSSMPVSSGGMGDPGCEGMTLRQWYAGQALNGILSRRYPPTDMESAVKKSFHWADAMIEYEENERIE